VEGDQVFEELFGQKTGDDLRPRLPIGELLAEGLQQILDLVPGSAFVAIGRFEAGPCVSSGTLEVLEHPTQVGGDGRAIGHVSSPRLSIPVTLVGRSPNCTGRAKAPACPRFRVARSISGGQALPPRAGGSEGDRARRLRGAQRLREPSLRR